MQLNIGIIICQGGDDGDCVYEGVNMTCWSMRQDSF